MQPLRAGEPASGLAAGSIGRRSKGRGQSSEVGRQSPEVRGRKSEDRGQRSGCFGAGWGCRRRYFFGDVRLFRQNALSLLDGYGSCRLCSMDMDCVGFV